MGKRGGLLGGGPPTCLGLGTCVGSPDGAHAGGRGPSSTTSTILGGGHTNGAPLRGGGPNAHRGGGRGPRAGEWEPEFVFVFVFRLLLLFFLRIVTKEGAKIYPDDQLPLLFFFPEDSDEEGNEKKNREVEVNEAEICPKIWPFNVNESR